MEFVEPGAWNRTTAAMIFGHCLIESGKSSVAFSQTDSLILTEVSCERILPRPAPTLPLSGSVEGVRTEAFW